MVFTSIGFDELFSARVSGHRAQRLALNAQPGKELIVIPVPHSAVWRYIAEVAL